MASDPPLYGYQPAQTSPTATLSLVAGILGLSVFPLFGSIIAVAAGYRAKREIAESDGELTGDGLATVGLALGYIGLGLLVVGLCGFAAVFTGLCALPLLIPSVTNDPTGWLPLVSAWG
ncbi:MAG: DUF4190 domain-containing protein [Anaerolineales bacterium]|nr:DUF4190 domain-containing protein [Anaerolineales bacterium]